MAECWCEVNIYALKGICECEEDCTCDCDICECEPQDVNSIIDLWSADMPATSACPCGGDCSCGSISNATQ